MSLLALRGKWQLTSADSALGTYELLRGRVWHFILSPPSEDVSDFVTCHRSENRLRGADVCAPVHSQQVAETDACGHPGGHFSAPSFWGSLCARFDCELSGEVKGKCSFTGFTRNPQGCPRPGVRKCPLHCGRGRFSRDEHKPKASSKKSSGGTRTAVTVCSRGAEPDSSLLCLLFSVCCYLRRLPGRDGRLQMVGSVSRGPGSSQGGSVLDLGVQARGCLGEQTAQCLPTAVSGLQGQPPCTWEGCHWSYRGSCLPGLWAAFPFWV